MGKKRTTLPKDFEDLLRKGDLEELKKVFDKCEVNALGGYSKQTALAFDDCPHELAEWLVEQGADLQTTDTWGNTPLHNRSRSYKGNIKSLLQLGADVNAGNNSGDTPLHVAAGAHNVENTLILLVHGARIDAVNKHGETAFRYALRTGSNIHIVRMAELSRIYLAAGAQKEPEMKELVTRIGEGFEFHRANFAKDIVEETSNALMELYRIFGVVPVPRRIIHDGVSPITTNEDVWQKQHEDLWQLLVPGSGPAATIQGEVIRISGKIGRELDGNGGVNWDSGFKMMADAYLEFIKLGNSLSPDELAEAEAFMEDIKRKSGNTERMHELGVKWVLENPMPMKLPPVKYKR